MPLILLSLTAPAHGQRSGYWETFEKIEMLVPDEGKVREISVHIRFTEDSIIITPESGGGKAQVMKYADIRGADYSYSNNPRWKTGLGLGATAIIFPPILLIAIPIGFTKHRRHWITIRTENDYAVLKVSKSIRRVFAAAFETRSKVRIEPLGENK